MSDIKAYLDHNATTPLKPDVRDIINANLDFCGNSSSVHKAGADAKKKIATARQEVADFCNAGKKANIIFTSGATEANNTVLKGCGCERIITSEIEHSSITNIPLEKELIPTLPNGVIDIDALDKMLEGNDRPTLISVLMVNNETGVIQPIDKVMEIAKKRGALVHSDAVQAMGRIPLDLQELGIDFLTLTSHKIGGPQGIGCLIISNCNEITPLLHGGGQEKKMRAGTENLLGIIGFGKAASLAKSGMEKYKELAKLRDRMESELLQIAPEIKFWGSNADRVANTSMFSVAGVPGETQLVSLDLEGICVSNGSACSSGTVKMSRILKAMGASDLDATSAVRVSLGWNSTAEDVDYFISKWSEIYNRIKTRISA